MPMPGELQESGSLDLRKFRVPITVPLSLSTRIDQLEQQMGRIEALLEDIEQRKRLESMGLVLSNLPQIPENGPK